MRRIKNLEETDIYRINPQLGPYPAELEFVFPFSQTISDRAAPRRVDRGLREGPEEGMGYSKVIVAGAAKGAKPPASD